MNKYVLELMHFGLRQAKAAIFGGLLLAAMIGVRFIGSGPLTQYDALFLIAIAIQAWLILGKHESRTEIKAILMFHIAATIMELFKTSPDIGSWAYTGDIGYFRIFTIPLFVGFLYSAVGSYIARAWRLLEIKVYNFPRLIYVQLLALGIYLNFFTHHYIWDMRYAMFLATAVIFWRTRFTFVAHVKRWSMPIMLGFVLVAFFIYLAENIGTLVQVWTYPSQSAEWHIVPFGKYGSWLLLMIVSFTLVASLQHHKLYKDTHPSELPK